MTPNNAAGAAPDSAHGRKPSQPGPRRVAIPLGLGRPRVPKPAPKSEPTTVQESKPEAEAEVKQNGSIAVQEDSNHATAVETSISAKESSPVEDTEAGQSSEQKPVTNGTSSHESHDESTAPFTPPQASQGAAQASSASSTRKPTNTRTELPPEFVPSAESHTPRSTTSTSRLNRNSQVFFPQSHVSRPSTSSIVFGGVDSSSSSPGPPQSAASEAANPSLQADATPSRFTQFSGPGGHPHSTSHQQQSDEKQGQSAVPRHLPPGLHAYANNFRYPPTDVAAASTPSGPNGHPIHSHIESPSSATANGTASEYELQASANSAMSSNGAMSATFAPTAYAGQAPMFQPSMYRMTPAQVQPYPDYSVDIDNAQQLRDHITSQYGNPSLSDCHLQIVQDADGSRSYLDAHKLILARSPTLLQLILDSNDPAAAHLKTQVSISLPGAYVTMNALNECIKYVYGGPLLQFDWHMRQSHSTQLPPRSLEYRLQYVLQYIATSAWLQLHVPAVRGVEIATTIFTWETLPTCLAFALEGGLSQVWDAESGDAEVAATSSMQHSTQTHDPYSTELLRHAVNFIASSIPLDFPVDASAPSISSVTNLPSPSTPSTEDPTPAQASKHKMNRSSDPRLSKIRFGELPLEASRSPTHTNTAISSILLSLPFQMLRALFAHPHLIQRLGHEPARKLAYSIVAERESRRSRAVEGVLKPGTSVELQLRERVRKRGRRGSIRLERARPGNGDGAADEDGGKSSVPGVRSELGMESGVGSKRWLAGATATANAEGGMALV